LIGLRFCDVAGGLLTNPLRTVELTCWAKCVFRHNLRQILQTAGVPVVDMRESDANLTVLN